MNVQGGDRAQFQAYFKNAAPCTPSEISTRITEVVNTIKAFEAKSGSINLGDKRITITDKDRDYFAKFLTQFTKENEFDRTQATALIQGIKESSNPSITQLKTRILLNEKIDSVESNQKIVKIFEAKKVELAEFEKIKEQKAKRMKFFKMAKIASLVGVGISIGVAGLFFFIPPPVGVLIALAVGGLIASFYPMANIEWKNAKKAFENADKESQRITEEVEAISAYVELYKDQEFIAALNLLPETSTDKEWIDFHKYYIFQKAASKALDVK